MVQKGEARDEKEAEVPDASSEPTARERAGEAHPPSSKRGATAPLEAVSLRDEARSSSAPPSSAAPASPAGGPWRSYKEILAGLAQRVLDAQRPIRILQSLRWEAEVEEQFLREQRRELPRVTYAGDLGFDPEAKIRELDELLIDAERELGKDDRLGKILRATAGEYRDVVRMLMARGTQEFHTHSRRLYGSTKDKFPDGRTSVRDMGFVLYDLLAAVGGERLGPPHPRDITAEMAAATLNARFDGFFGSAAIHVQVDDSLLADAAAGSDYVKIRSGAMFSRSDIDILEAHEGWVHVATSLNGQAQPVARWLAKGPPPHHRRARGPRRPGGDLHLPQHPAPRQEAQRSHPRRRQGRGRRELPRRLRVVSDRGLRRRRVLPELAPRLPRRPPRRRRPFTKDACYCKGIVLNYAFMRAAIQQDKAQLIPFLFVGKVAHEDIPVLYAHVTDGIVKPPPFLPPIFDDMSGLAIWMCYSSFFSRLGGTAITEHYAKVLGG